jgi:hypothetical protein
VCTDSIERDDLFFIEADEDDLITCRVINIDRFTYSFERGEEGIREIKSERGPELWYAMQLREASAERAHRAGAPKKLKRATSI